MLNCFFKCLLLCVYCFSLSVPNPNGLEKIYKISDAKNTEIIAIYPEYQDSEKYGERPNSLDDKNLLTLNSTFNWESHDSYGIKSLKDLYVAKVNGAYISPKHLGTIFTNNQQFLFDIMVSPGYPMFWPVDSSVTNYGVQRYKKIATVQGPTLFYHWVIDRLPSVFLLRDLLLKDPEMKLIINDYKGGVASYVHAYLDLLGIPASQIIVGHNRAVYYADEVYFATPFLMEPIPKNLLVALKNELIRNALTRAQKRYNDNLIVIIQRREADRRFSNIDQLSQVLRNKFPSNKYELVVFDDNMPLCEQINIFNNAKLVISPMASGLTNIIYTKPDTTIVEIHQTLPYLVDAAGLNKYGAEWCWWLSSAVGAKYWVIPTAYKLSDLHISAPIDAIEKILQTIVL